VGNCAGYDKLPFHERYILRLVLLRYGNITGMNRFEIINTSLRLQNGENTTAMHTFIVISNVFGTT